ncbi:hypothetical protein B9Z65_5200 [Elsinoe australis]|uniref:Ornithine decarboxylase antizyme n=1 Tax=Elsinoe australis TaxID=40998 RepID=A0A2P7ZDD9_9PEZI|nr:hypothetical protein B9Z65_5200 [Elsinoe australis]
MSSNFVKRNAARANIQASAYAVDAGPGGGFEVSTGIPSPPQSPRRTAAALDNSSTPAATSPTSAKPIRRTSTDSIGSHASNASSTSSSRISAAHTITEECERLFCGTLRSVFLGEGRTEEQDPLVTGALNDHGVHVDGKTGSVAIERKDNKLGLGRKDSGLHKGRPMALPTPPSSLTSEDVAVGGPVEEHTMGMVTEFVEVWTYHSGLRFRGFVTEKDGERALFVFFEKNAVGKDLKKPLMALLELAGTPEFGCEHLVACLDRETDTKEDHDDLVRDLGWVGFEPTTLEPWCPGAVDITSDRWLFLSMEV